MPVVNSASRKEIIEVKSSVNLSLVTHDRVISKKKIKSLIHLCKKDGYHPQPRYTAIDHSLKNAAPPKNVIVEGKFHVSFPKALRGKRMEWACIEETTKDKKGKRLKWWYVVVPH